MNITIDDVIEYMIITNIFEQRVIELSDTDLFLLVDIVRDKRHLMNISNHQSIGRYTGIARINIKRPKKFEWHLIYLICKFDLNIKIKYQPERITKSLLNKKGNYEKNKK